METFNINNFRQADKKFLDVFWRKKNMVSRKGLGNMPLTKPKNQYTKNGNGDVTSVFHK